MNELEEISTRYLLGELSEQEQDSLEERYFRDPKLFNAVMQVESELVDAYARGQLSTDMRERFEKSYLNHPARRKRVNFAKALTTRIDQREQSVTRLEQSARSALPSSWWKRLFVIVGGQAPPLRFAMATIIVLVALVGVWFFVNRWRQQQREAAQIQAQRENQEHREREQTASQQPKETPQDSQQRVPQIPPESSQPSPNSNTNAAPPIVSLALTVGGVRSADGSVTQTLVIPHDTTQANILLDLKDDSYPRYRVSLRKIGGSEIFTQTNIRPHSTKAGPRFVFKVPASRLTSGDYALTLGGITPEGEVDDLNKSLFRVEKR